jgi:hypothetical protein
VFINIKHQIGVFCNKQNYLTARYTIWCVAVQVHVEQMICRLMFDCVNIIIQLIFDTYLIIRECILVQLIINWSHCWSRNRNSEHIHRNYLHNASCGGLSHWKYATEKYLTMMSCLLLLYFEQCIKITSLSSKVW